jgi:hypothetical protein
MKYRALVDLSIRDDKGGWLNAKAGEEFTPPKQMHIESAVAQGHIEAVEKVKDNG